MTAIKFAGISPHPPIIVPEVGRGREREAQATLDALARLAADLRNHAPQTVVLIATHGPLREAAFALLTAPRAEGDFAQWGAPQLQLRFEVDGEAVQAIAEEARRAGLPLVAIDRWGNGLDWSCTVPLYHLRPGLEGAKLVFLTVSFLSPRQHFALGQAVRRALEGLGRPAAVIASADLSHRLSPEGPYGFDPAGPQFDRAVREAVARWDVATILDMDSGFRERAGDDAVPSLSFLMGALDGLRVWPRVLSYQGPWGVGYLVAAVDILGEDEPTLSRASARDVLTDGVETVATREALRPAQRVAPSHPLARLAREAVEAWVRQGLVIEADDPPAELPQRAGCFVSIKTVDGLLRGCLGTIEPSQPTLAQEVIKNAIDAASRDPRFLPVTPDELDCLVYSVDVLSPPEPVNGPEALDPRRYGVIVRNGYRRGLLLPDLEGVDTVEQQLAIAKAKAGIAPEEPAELWRFEVQRYT